MKVYLAHDLSNIPMYGDVPDLTQEKEKVVSFEITEEDSNLIDDLFVDQTNELCEATLDLGDYQYYNASQCALLLEWLNNVSREERMIPLLNFFNKLKDYLQYAIANNTGIAIEL